MSVNYASGLSYFPYKGKCGQPERFDPVDLVSQKVDQLAAMVEQTRHLVVITGAGVSTSAGIPDFRGPNGVWTLEEKGIKPEVSVTFETAKPTFTHNALVALEEKAKLKYLISQNVDGLHMRSGFPLNRLAELHGNMFVEQCPQCNTKYIRAKAVGTMALRPTGNVCTQVKTRGRCRGRLRDTILDWEDALPVSDLEESEQHCRRADLCLTLGTSLQIVPCGNMPLLTRRAGGHFVSVSLQPTKHDRVTDLQINACVDDVMRALCKRLGIEVDMTLEPHVVEKSSSDADSVTPSIVIDNSLILTKLCKPENSLLMNGIAVDKVVTVETNSLNGDVSSDIRHDSNTDHEATSDCSEKCDTKTEDVGTASKWKMDICKNLPVIAGGYRDSTTDDVSFDDDDDGRCPKFAKRESKTEPCM